MSSFQIFYTKKTTIVTKGGKTTKTVEETSSEKPVKEPKVMKKFNKIMEDFGKLMDEL